MSQRIARAEAAGLVVRTRSLDELAASLKNLLAQLTRRFGTEDRPEAG